MFIIEQRDSELYQKLLSSLIFKTFVIRGEIASKKCPIYCLFLRIQHSVQFRTVWLRTHALVGFFSLDNTDDRVELAKVYVIKLPKCYFLSHLFTCTRGSFVWQLGIWVLQ